jgi:hypothetical protein
MQRSQIIENDLVPQITDQNARYFLHYRLKYLFKYLVVYKQVIKRRSMKKSNIFRISKNMMNFRF